MEKMTFLDYDMEIAAAMEDIDPETGELRDPERLVELLSGKKDKIEGLALYAKSMAAMSKAIKDEIESLTKRKKTTDNAEQRAKDYLKLALNGEKLTTPKVAVSYRKSKSVVIPDEKQVPNMYLVKKETYAPDKKAIKEAIERGEEVLYAILSENVSVTVK